MPLVNTKEMFAKAYNGGYAIGAFNVNNMEIIQGIVEAAKAQNAPLILQVSKGARAYANHTYLVKLVEAAEKTTGLPIALHLDHLSIAVVRERMEASAQALWPPSIPSPFFAWVTSTSGLYMRTMRDTCLTNCTSLHRSYCP